MPSLFVDTSGWLCHLDRAQPGHDIAVSTVMRFLAEGNVLVTTSYVITELVSLLLSRTRLARAEMVRGVEAIQGSPNVKFVHVTPTLHQRGWEMFLARPDKEWSLVDCVSFVLMRDLGIAEALSTDHHFIQAGFSRLIEP